MDRPLLTRQGRDRLEKELEHLRRVELPANVRAIEEARAHGDLSENAEYHAAKERNAVIFAKINELKSILGTSEVVDPLPEVHGRVVFGCSVTVYDEDTDQESTYQLVGPAESDASLGRLSLSSPLGQALLGKEEGDQVSFKAPSGVRTLEIVAVGEAS